MQSTNLQLELSWRHTAHSKSLCIGLSHPLHELTVTLCGWRCTATHRCRWAAAHRPPPPPPPPPPQTTDPSLRVGQSSLHDMRCTSSIVLAVMWMAGMCMSESPSPGRARGGRGLRYPEGELGTGGMLPCPGESNQSWSGREQMASNSTR